MQAIRRLPARVRGLDPLRFDVGLAAILIAAGLLESALVDPVGEQAGSSDGGSRVLTAVVAVVGLLPMAWRRRAPFVCAVVFAAVTVGSELLDTFYMESLTAPFLAMLILLYTLGRYSSGRRTWAGVAILILGLWTNILLASNAAGDEVLWTVLLFVPPVLAGRAMRSRVMLQSELRQKAERLEAEREERARQAVEHERNRIAAELQAVVAQGVSAMVVQAEGVPRVLASGETARASESLALIEETGRDALAEMRRLLGVLRRDEHGPALAPQPSLCRAEALVGRMREAGVPIDLEVEGRPGPLAPGVDLAGYRVLQEALSSATAAGGVARVEVTVEYGEREVTLAVRDDRANGQGLDPAAVSALRERVGLYGGALRAGPRTSGRGFKLTARLPRGEAPA